MVRFKRRFWITHVRKDLFWPANLYRVQAIRNELNDNHQRSGNPNVLRQNVEKLLEL